MIDRHFSFNGGETIAALALMALGIWMALDHMPTLQACLIHANITAGQIASNLRG